MDILHRHLKECDSTQIEVKKLLDEASYTGEILISTAKQHCGRGRMNRSWATTEGSLAFSFTLRPHEVLTLTPLEIAIQINRYFENHLSFKWPNDLINQKNQKVGGILCEIKNSRIICGVGINLQDSQTLKEIEGKLEAGYINTNKDDLALIAKEITGLILKNRLTKDEILSEWKKNCIHLNKEVCIDKTKGIFVDLTDDGFAIVEAENERKIISSGDLVLTS